MDEMELEPAAGLECTLRLVGAPLRGGLEVSIDGSEYRACRRTAGGWRLNWEKPWTATEPVVAVIRAAPEGLERD